MASQSNLSPHMDERMGILQAESWKQACSRQHHFCSLSNACTICNAAGLTCGSVSVHLLIRSFTSWGQSSGDLAIATQP